MQNVAAFGKFSFELEEKREQSLITQSGHLLTVLSILTAAILMALPLLIDHTIIPQSQILAASGIVLAPLIVSIVLCVITQWRFGYQTMMNATAFQEKISADLKSYPSQAQYDFQWCNQLSEIQDSRKKNNDTRVKLIKGAICSLLLSVLFIVVTWLLFIVKYA